LLISRRTVSATFIWRCTHRPKLYVAPQPSGRGQESIIPWDEAARRCGRCLPTDQLARPRISAGKCQLRFEKVSQSSLMGISWENLTKKFDFLANRDCPRTIPAPGSNYRSKLIPTCPPFYPGLIRKRNYSLSEFPTDARVCRSLCAR
jgi:hypothetical protein